MATTTSLPPLTFNRFFTTWYFDPWITGFVVVILAGYLFALWQAGKRGTTWPAWRVVGFVILGGGSVVLSTMSSLGVYDRVLLWPAAVEVTMLLTIVPLCLGMGDPIGLISAALPPTSGAKWDRLLHSRVLRVLCFPAVGAILATVTQFVIFFTGYLGAAMQSDTILHLLQLQVVVTGCLFALPLLGIEILPAWCNQPIRMTFASIDGLLDAIPGIAVIGAERPIGVYYKMVHPIWAGGLVHEQSVAGGLMITVSEMIAIPFVAVLFRAWIHEDAAAAEVLDARLDREERTARQQRVERAEPSTPAEDEGRSKPWWETDPGPLSDRAKRYGWRDPN